MPVVMEALLVEALGVGAGSRSDSCRVSNIDIAGGGREVGGSLGGCLQSADGGYRVDASGCCFLLGEGVSKGGRGRGRYKSRRRWPFACQDLCGFAGWRR